MKGKKYSEEELKIHAIEFHKYYMRTALLSFFSSGENHGSPLEQIYDRFLKNKGKTITEIKNE